MRATDEQIKALAKNHDALMHLAEDRGDALRIAQAWAAWAFAEADFWRTESRADRAEAKLAEGTA